jgi:hypothetical protein
MNTENNKIIAKFMKIDTAFDDTFSINPMTKYGCWEKMKYDTDWNWLMEVVEKIETIKHCQVSIIKNWCRIEHSKYNSRIDSRDYSDNFTKLEAVYNACVEFIKWYNENK